MALSENKAPTSDYRMKTPRCPKSGFIVFGLLQHQIVLSQVREYKLCDFSATTERKKSISVNYGVLNEATQRE